MSAPAPGPRVRCPDLSFYVSAEDFFEAVRDAAKEREKIIQRISTMEVREGVRAQSYEAMGRSGFSDRTTATDNRIDYVTDKSRLLEEDEDMISFALSLIWGGDGGDMGGGVLSLMGYETASAMEERYVHALPWSEVARRMGYSGDYTGKVKELCRLGLECVDALCAARVVSGEGDAT